MNLLPHMAARLFGAPLLIHRPKLDVILAVLGSRVGLLELAAPADPLSSSPPAPRAPASADPSIAVLPIHGTLVRRTVGLEAASGLLSYSAIAAQLDAALADPDVGAILLDIDSPGGESGGVFDLADRIRAAAAVKPVWAVANDAAFSAAYALASAASRVFVPRTGGVGSIGVIAMHVDQSMRDAQEGVRYTAVFAGARKNDLSPHEPISGEAHAFLQGEVDRVYGLFTETVARHRGLSADAVRATEAGLFFGQDAIAAGLADALGSFDDALAQLADSVSSPSNPGTHRPGSVLHFTQAPSMNEPTLSSPPALSAPSPALSPTAPPSLTSADALEIAQTCTLAGRPDLIAEFLFAGASPDQVRSRLLAAQAAQSPEIVSRIGPNTAAQASAAAADPASPDNPLIQAVKRRLALQPANRPAQA